METVRNVQAMSVQFGVNELVYSPKMDLMMIIIFTIISLTESNKSLTRSGFEFLKRIRYGSSERVKLNQNLDYNIYYLIKLEFNDTVPIGLDTWATGKQFAQNLGAKPSPACRFCQYRLCSTELNILCICICVHYFLYSIYLINCVLFLNMVHTV
jgi:hypothetical protein